MPCLPYWKMIYGEPRGRQETKTHTISIDTGCFFRIDCYNTQQNMYRISGVWWNWWCNFTQIHDATCVFLWSLLVGQGYPQHTPPKFEMEPDNDGFPKESLFLGAGFQVPCSTPLELQRLEFRMMAHLWYIGWYGSAIKGSLYRRLLGL